VIGEATMTCGVLGGVKHDEGKHDKKSISESRGWSLLKLKNYRRRAFNPSGFRLPR
jgi:hypothetical protein